MMQRQVLESASTPSASAARASEASRASTTAPRRTVTVYSAYECATQTVFASGLDRPTGLALADDALYVAKHEAGPFEGASGARLGTLETDWDYALHPGDGALERVDRTARRSTSSSRRRRVLDGVRGLLRRRLGRRSATAPARIRARPARRPR